MHRLEMAKTKDDPVVEDVDDDEISSDDDSDDVPELEEADGSTRTKQSKMEKKSRCVCHDFFSDCAASTPEDSPNCLQGRKT